MSDHSRFFLSMTSLSDFCNGTDAAAVKKGKGLAETEAQETESQTGSEMIQMTAAQLEAWFDNKLEQRLAERAPFAGAAQTATSSRSSGRQEQRDDSSPINEYQEPVEAAAANGRHSRSRSTGNNSHVWQAPDPPRRDSRERSRSSTKHSSRSGDSRSRSRNRSGSSNDAKETARLAKRLADQEADMWGRAEFNVCWYITFGFFPSCS